MEKTTDCLSDWDLAELLGEDPDDDNLLSEYPGPIKTRDGEWRRECKNRWRFWRNPE